MFRRLLLLSISILPSMLLAAPVKPAAPVVPAVEREIPGLLRTERTACQITAPAGWVFRPLRHNRSRGHGFALQPRDTAVLFRPNAAKAPKKDRPPKEAYTGISGRIVDPRYENAEEYAFGVVHMMTSRSEDMEARKVGNATTGGGQPAFVYEFISKKGRLWEKVAYIQLPDGVVLISFSARTEAMYKKYMPGLDDVLRTFRHAPEHRLPKPAPSPTKPARKKQ